MHRNREYKYIPQSLSLFSPSHYRGVKPSSEELEVVVPFLSCLVNVSQKMTAAAPLSPSSGVRTQVLWSQYQYIHQANCRCQILCLDYRLGCCPTCCCLLVLSACLDLGRVALHTLW